MVPAPYQNIDHHTLISTGPSNTTWPYLDIQLTDVAAFSLIFVIDRASRKVLLGTKKRGYGQGLVHGFGGKIESGETILQCAERELLEESGLRAVPGHMQPKGRLIFVRPTESTGSITDIALFVVDAWIGDPQETEEMSPAWYSVDFIPLDSMWPDVRLYFAPLLESVMASNTYEQLLVRIDYGLISDGVPSALPCLRSVGVNSRVEDARARGLQEVIVRHWLAYASLPF